MDVGQDDVREISLLEWLVESVALLDEVPQYGFLSIFKRKKLVMWNWDLFCNQIIQVEIEKI